MEEKGLINYADPAMVETLKATVAAGATDAEFVMFAELCKATGLNPFKKEVWFVKSKGYRNKQGEDVPGKCQIMTGVNGYLAIANRHPQFDGMETEVVRDEKTGKPIKAICKVYRKDRRVAHTADAYFSEYYQPTFSGKQGIWDKLPSVMIAKVAKSLALREAFSQELNGLYTEEEMPKEFAAPSIEVHREEVRALPPGVKPADEIQPAPRPVAQPVRVENPLKLATQKAAETGASYQYDYDTIRKEIVHPEAKKELAEKTKAAGCVLLNGCLHCLNPLPDLAAYLMHSPESQTIDAVMEGDDIPWTTTEAVKPISKEEAQAKVDAIKNRKKAA